MLRKNSLRFISCGTFFAIKSLIISPNAIFASKQWPLCLKLEASGLPNYERNVSEKTKKEVKKSDGCHNIDNSKLNKLKEKIMPKIAIVSVSEMNENFFVAYLPDKQILAGLKVNKKIEVNVRRQNNVFMIGPPGFAKAGQVECVCSSGSDAEVELVNVFERHFSAIVGDLDSVNPNLTKDAVDWEGDCMN